MPDLIDQLIEKKDHKNLVLDQSWTINSIDDDVYQILLGMMVGDGGLEKISSTKKSVLIIKHFNDQQPYAEWKAERLKIFLPNIFRYTMTRGDNYTLAVTKSHKIFGDLREKFYSENAVIKRGRAEGTKNKIHIPYYYKWNLFGLLIWYLDNGCLCARSDCHCCSPMFASSRLSIEKLNEFCNFLNPHFGLNLYTRHNGGGNGVYLTIPDRKYLFPIWHQLFDQYKIPEEMRYKVDFYD